MLQRHHRSFRIKHEFLLVEIAIPRGRAQQVNEYHRSTADPNSPLSVVDDGVHPAELIRLVVDALQLTPDTPKPGAPSGMQPGVQPGMQPGMLKMSLTIVILNFDQWKEEKPHA